MIELASLGRMDVVFEVGTGQGTLTQLLARRAEGVISCEVDKALLEEA